MLCAHASSAAKAANCGSGLVSWSCCSPWGQPNHESRNCGKTDMPCPIPRRSLNCGIWARSMSCMIQIVALVFAPTQKTYRLALAFMLPCSNRPSVTPRVVTGARPWPRSHGFASARRTSARRSRFRSNFVANALGCLQIVSGKMACNCSGRVRRLGGLADCLCSRIGAPPASG
jgi:hypothetical protein